VTFDIGELRKLDCAGAGSRKPPSAIIHNDNSVIRNTNHILSARGVEIRHLNRKLVRERQWRITGGVVTQPRQVLVNTCAALTAKILAVAHQSWMSVRNGVTSVLRDLIDAGKATGTRLLLGDGH
jgi:hypothetical protein